MLTRLCLSLTLLAGLAACGGGQGGSLQSFEIVGGQQRYLVDIFDQGEGVRDIVVSSQGYRALQQSDASVAFSVAQQAADRIPCANGQGVRVLPSTGFFQDDSRSGALSRGGAFWQFKGRCGG